MKLKKILCLIFALSMIVAMMTACGGDKDENSGTASTGGNSSTTVSLGIDPDMTNVDDKYKNNWDPYAQIPASSKGVTVRYATWINQHEDIGGYTLANVKNDIGIGVELYMVEQDGYVNTIMTKIASGDIPDVFITNEGDGAFPNTIQIAAPINKVSSVDLGDPRWDKSFLDTATIEGNIYYLNTIGSPMANGNMVFYNKRLFRENGFTTPAEYYEQGTWSWDTLLKCAKDIKSLGSEYKGIHIEMDILAGSVGASVTQYNFSTHTFSNGTGDPNLLKAYQWYADAKEQNLLDGSIGSFKEGKCALFIRGTYGLEVKGYFMGMNPEDIGYTWLPSFTEGEKGRISSIYGAHGIVVNAPNADAAGYFLRYWMDYKNWDIENAFITTEAAQFFYEITNCTANDKYFNFDDPLASLIGEKATSAFYKHISGVSSAGMKTALDSISNTVDTAVAKGNELIANKIAADREKYQ